MNEAPLKLAQIEIELQEWMGNDKSIADSAWTSTYNKTKRIKRSDEEVRRVVLAMIEGVKNGDPAHNVPFESVIFRFWFRLPIFTDRQHMTHRLQSGNGLSGRYRTMPEDWYHIPADVMDILARASDEQHNLQLFAQEYDAVCKKANYVYRDCLGHLKQAEAQKKITNKEYKRTREVFRGMLPTAGMTERTTTMNLGSFANYQFKRNHSHAQDEIRFIAQEMLRLVKEANICPIAIEALESINWRL